MRCDMTFLDRMIRLLGLCLTISGAALFLVMTVLLSLPARTTERIELPNERKSPQIIAPDGQVFVANSYTFRIQRYGPDGFERGFWVDAGGGSFAIGLTADGLILVCTQRERHLITYTRDGQEIGSRGTCPYDPGNNGLMLSNGASPFASHAKVPRVATHWLSAAALPLAYHPFYAWILFGLGICILKYVPPSGANPENS
jgi:hypothetical protein